MTDRRVARHAGRSLCFLMVWIALVGVLLVPGESSAQGAPPTRIGPARPFAARSSDGIGSAWWRSLLAASKDLGPSHAPSAQVVLDLRASAVLTLVQQWADSRGLTVTPYAQGLVALLSGPSARLGHSLGVRIDQYRAPGGKRFMASARQARIPAALQGVVTGLGRISSYQDWRADALDYVPAGGLTPSGLLAAYDAGPLASRGDQGAGETVVVFEVDGYSKSDLATFATNNHLPSFSQGSGALSVVGGQAGSPEGESTMDLETLREIAPKAHLVYDNLLTGSTNQSTATGVLLKAFTAANTRFPGAIWSLSLGFCEKAFTFADVNAVNQVVAQAEKNGTSVFASSGDTGGLDCTPQGNWGAIPEQEDQGVQIPAVLPAVTGVGGTTLSVTSSGSYASEASWFYPAMGQGTGGGMSTLFAQPTWQVGSGLPTPSTSEPRQVPDVAADADPVTGNAIVSGGGPSVGSGTSLAAPIWAGFTALMDAYLRGQNQCVIGAANPDLYALADHAQSYPAFHVVTTGGNNVYRNGTGYSPTTGLGSPDVWNMVRDLVSLKRCPA